MEAVFGTEENLKEIELPPYRLLPITEASVAHEVEFYDLFDGEGKICASFSKYADEKQWIGYMVKTPGYPFVQSDTLDIAAKEAISFLALIR